MNVIEICIAFLAAIVSVGTPLIFDVISKVDDKYHSEVISDLLNKTSKKKTFQVLLQYISGYLLFCLIQM